tara:strand:+ start:360 stop:638 length:279 start_codon:yes stop_codon:yes gene_type:complete
MTFYYQTTSYSNQEPTKELIEFWELAANKKNWRIVQLPNGFFQTEINTVGEEWKDVTRRENIEAAESAIDSSILHYAKRVELSKGPVVVKTF